MDSRGERRRGDHSPVDLLQNAVVEPYHQVSVVLPKCIALSKKRKRCD